VSASNPAVPEPTEIAGRYLIVRKLGAGAFGTVYKAKDTRLERMVAIKTIRLEGLAASQTGLKEMVDRFQREAKTAAKLKHPGIVTIHDFGESQGLSYIAMEFIDGIGIDHVIAETGRMPAERAAALGAQVAEALDYAHKHGVVHRDIKPANIMIEAGDRVKVTDFGIAKPGDSAEHLTMTGSLLGTPSYMSPEQARGQTLDGRSDLFSAGCVLYEMVAGKKAFRGDSITALLFKIITEEPPSLRELDPTVSDEMLRIIAKALSKSPEARYQTGRELADDLLAVTRPGFVPTLRATDTPTLPPDAAPADVPTIASPPTIRPEATIGSAATAARPASTSSTQPAPGAPPPLPPTILTPPTARVERPLAARPAPPTRPAPPLVSRPAARKGSGAVLIAGLGLAAVLALAVIAGGAWYLFGRKGPPTPPSPALDSTPLTATPAQADASLSTTTTEMPAPADAGGPAGAAPPATEPAAPPVPRVAGGGAATRPTTPAAPATGVDTPASGGATGGGDYAYLDDLPSETPDGRAAGEALAQKYRSGGATGYPATRFRQRPRLPPGVTMPERPAVATLLYLHSAEEAYHRKSGRYGNLRELADASLFVLDVPFEAEGFRRARYGFRVTAEADGYRVEAVPQGPGGRAFLVDDSGFVRLRDD